MVLACCCPDYHFYFPRLPFSASSAGFYWMDARATADYYMAVGDGLWKLGEEAGVACMVVSEMDNI